MLRVTESCDSFNNEGPSSDVNNSPDSITISNITINLAVGVRLLMHDSAIAVTPGQCLGQAHADSYHVTLRTTLGTFEKSSVFNLRPIIAGVLRSVFTGETGCEQVCCGGGDTDQG